MGKAHILLKLWLANIKGPIATRLFCYFLSIVSCKKLNSHYSFVSMITLASLLPGAAYAFVSAVTPGPNNILLTASGISYGFKRTLPHMLGIQFGFAVLLTLCAVGVGALIVNVPAAEIGLKIFGTAYMLWLAWQLRQNSIKPDGDEVTDGRPMTFMQAAVFQFANPKAWVFALTGASVYIPNGSSFALSILILIVLFGTVMLPCEVLWAGMGSIVKSYLQNPRIERIFSTVIVLLTIYAAVAIWFPLDG